MTEQSQLPSGKTENYIDIREIFGAIWRRKWVVVVFLVLSQLLYLGLHLSAPRLFTTDTGFIFKDSQSSMSGLGGLASLVGIRPQAKTNLSDFFEVIMFNDEFLGKIVDRKW